MGILVGLIFVLTMFAALAPPIRFDALVYHLTLPRIYLQTQRMIYVPQLMFWGMPQSAEMLYLFAMSLGGEGAAALLGWLIGLAALVGILGYVADQLASSPAWAAVAALACGYTLAASLSWAYNDWWVLLFGLGFLVSITLWSQERQAGSLWLAALFAGFALGTKYTAGVLIVCGSVVILWRSLRRTGVQSALKALFQFGALALLVFSPWLVKNWTATGNPFYPLLFPAGAMTELRLQLYQGGPAWGNWLDVFLLPLRSTFLGVEGAPGYNASIGPLLLGLCPAAVLSWRGMNDRQRKFLMTCALTAISGVVVWMIMGRFSSYLLQARLYVAFFPAVAALAGAGFAGLSAIVSNGVRFGRVAGFLVLLVLGLTVLELGLQSTRQESLPAALGLKTEQEYLEDNLGWFAPAMKALNDLPQGARTLMLWEPRSYYCLPTCEPDEIIDRWLRERYPDPGGAPASPQEILNSWRASGYTHLLLHRSGADFVKTEDQRYQPSDWDALEQLLNLLNRPDSFGDAYLMYSLNP